MYFANENSSSVRMPIDHNKYIWISLGIYLVLTITNMPSNWTLPKQVPRAVEAGALIQANLAVKVSIVQKAINQGAQT